MDALTLLRLNLEIENTLDPQGDLIPLPGKSAAWLVASRYAGGCAAFFHHRLPLSIKQELRALGSETLVTSPQAARALLSAFVPDPHVQTFVGYYFAAMPAPHEYPDVIFDGVCFNIYVDGRAVSSAWTQDSSPQACELAVETDEAYRRRGYARQVCSAWAAYVLQTGRVAFYSHKLENEPSAALARNLGVRWYAQSTSFEGEAA